MLRKFIKKFRPHGFAGGILPPQKKRTATSAIRCLPLSALYIVPIKQHIGMSCQPIVSVGDYVLRGQKIAKAPALITASIHAPTSGKVIKIEEHAVPHPSGLGMLCIFIETDGDDTADESLSPLSNYHELDPAIIRERVRVCGLAGLGGALFPSHVKLLPNRQHPIDTLILNGVECESWLTCDHRLMLEKAEAIIIGADIIMYAIKAKKCIIAVEDNKVDAIAHLQQVLQTQQKIITNKIAVQSLPTRYPQGSEKQLITALTGKQSPRGGLPSHVGIVLHNVGTAKAVHDAVLLGQPLIERVTTISGMQTPKPGNSLVRIGTPLKFIFKHHGLDDLTGLRIIHGGPMMGEILPILDVPLIKGSNGLLAMSDADIAALGQSEQACIRCGLCSQACPIKLVPNELAHHCRHDHLEEAQEFNLFDCIECGCCAYVCPSHIPLVQWFRYGKGQAASVRKEREFSDASRQRTHARDQRLAIEVEQKAAKRRAVRSKAAQKKDEEA
ncbi:MAG: electron transport complex subunit RsxC [Mariprofundales bacterium]